MSKQDGFYFENFHQCAMCAVEAAHNLEAIVSNFDRNTIEERARELHKVEHGADLKKHELLEQLVRSFMTPFDRDDIISLSQSIDDAIDAIEDIVINLNITGVTVLRDDAIDFAKVLVSCCVAMGDLLSEFRDYKKSGKIKELIININNLEEDGDAIFLSAMKRLYAEKKPYDIVTWGEIYRAFENACDACEEVADIVESIIIENI